MASNHFVFLGPDLSICFIIGILVSWVPLKEIFSPSKFAVLKPEGFEFWVEDRFIPLIYKRYQVEWNDVMEIYTRKIVNSKELPVKKGLVYLDGRGRGANRQTEPDFRTTIISRVSLVPLKIERISISYTHPQYFFALEFLKKKVDPLRIEKETTELNRENLKLISKESVNEEAIDSKKIALFLTYILLFIIMIYFLYQQTQQPHIHT